MGCAPAIGPVVAGFVIDAFGWHILFYWNHDSVYQHKTSCEPLRSRSVYLHFPHNTGKCRHFFLLTLLNDNSIYLDYLTFRKKGLFMANVLTKMGGMVSNMIVWPIGIRIPAPAACKMRAKSTMEKLKCL